MKDERIILGIDPGTNIMGYGVIKVVEKQPLFVIMDVIHLSKVKDQYLKLKKIFETTIQLIEKYCPDELAIETPFYGKNVQSMLKLGRAQGTAIAAAITRSIPVFEYAPRKIKLSLTGRGNASKEQVAGFIAGMFKIKDIPENLDATDGLAAALCHFNQKKYTSDKNSYNSWNDYLNKNPGKIKNH